MVDLLDELTHLPSTPYDKKTRYADFRTVFNKTEQGRRVLREILAWGGMFSAPVLGDPIDPNRTHVLLGQRNIALKLIKTVYVEPPEPPVKQKRKTNG